MKKIIPIAGLILSMTATGASAELLITENKLDVSAGMLTIEGVTDEPNKFVSLNIPKIGITPGQLQASDNAGASIFYSGQTVSGANGAFTFVVDFDGADEGAYEIYVGSETEDVAKKTGASYLTLTNYGTLVGNLNSAAATGKTAFDDAFDLNEDSLFLYTDIAVQNKDVVKDVLYNFAKDSGFSTTDSTFNMSVYKAALAAQLISDGRVSDAKTLFDDMYVAPDGIMDTYDTVADFATYINTDAKREYFASVFDECQTFADFDEAFADALILTVVRYPENVTRIKNVFEKYNEYIDADTDKANLNDYSSISGKEYSKIEDCVKKFNDAVGGSGGGGGGGGSSSGSSNSGFGVVTPGSANVKNDTIDIKFEDLNSVPWAYTAVSELFERNIVSGKSETRFAPNDRVTREEFAKMLVDMAGVQVDNSSNIFSDVIDGAWYKGYVNAAYNNGFCNGVGNGLFGVGTEITRQDMCVMAYNVLNAMGHNVPAGELIFDDAGAISDYAKEPVAGLSGAGIVNGVGSNRFNPMGNATRAEAAVIIYKVLMYIG